MRRIFQQFGLLLLISLCASCIDLTSKDHSKDATNEVGINQHSGDHDGSESQGYRDHEGISVPKSVAISPIIAGDIGFGSFSLVNDSGSLLTINEVTGSCSCVVIKSFPSVIPSAGKGEVSLEYRTRSVEYGSVARTIEIRGVLGGRDVSRRVEIRSEVLREGLVAVPDRMRLEGLTCGATVSAEHRIEVLPRTRGTVTQLRIDSCPDWMTEGAITEESDGSYQLRFHVKCSDIQDSFNSDVVILYRLSGDERRLTIPVTLALDGGIILKPERIVAVMTNPATILPHFTLSSRSVASRAEFIGVVGVPQSSVQHTIECLDGEIHVRLQPNLTKRSEVLDGKLLVRLFLADGTDQAVALPFIFVNGVPVDPT